MDVNLKKQRQNQKNGKTKKQLKVMKEGDP
jgi:hypothetical protein